MIRKVSTALSVTATFVALLGVLMVPTAVPASALPGGSCSIVVPATVSMDRPYKVITGTLGSDCAVSGATYASWNVRHSYYGPSNIFIMNNTRSNTLGLYDWGHYGTYYVEPSMAYDADFNSLTQNTRSYVVKSGSGVGVTASRVGSYVTLSVWTTYYNAAADVFRMWPQAKVQLQYRSCTTCAWTYLRNVYTASNGRTTYRAYTAHARYYRAVSAATSSIWGRTSTVIVR